jgi:hypothetical protein
VAVSLPELSIADVGLIGAYVVALWVPGALVAAAGGLRGWQLTAAAPLLTYAVVGLAGPWTSALGIPWSPAVPALVTVVFAGVLAALRLVLRERPREPRVTWSRGGDLGVAAAVVVAILIGATAVLGGMRRLTTVPQDWDAVFHANGIRWIADTGDAGLFGMSQVNWYEPGTAIFYPNAYHLLGAVLRQLTDRDLPSILNAHTALIPGLGALVLAALVRRFGGSPVQAAGAALSAVAVSAVYDMLWRGPLLPYATGVALTPVFVLLMADFLDARWARDRLSTGALLALATAGLVCLHPAMLFGAAVLGVGYLGWRWIRRPRGLRIEPLLLVAAGVGGLALSFMQVGGSLYSASSFPPVDWLADLSWEESITQLLTFSHAASTVQFWLTALAAVGLLCYHRLGELRWIGAPALAFGALFVLAASSDAEWVNALTRPWWNDRWRLAGVFALLACVLIGHGLAQLHDLLRAGIRLVTTRAAEGAVADRRTVQGTVAAVVLLAYLGVTQFLYLDRNTTKMAMNTGEGPAISSGEIAAMDVLGKIVPPNARVLNDRNDGSVWMYALAGVHPVAGHYDGTGFAGTDVELLMTSFNAYPHDQEVREAVRRLGVEYVMLGEGFLRGGTQRAAGLTHLQDAAYLDVVYRNDDAVVYRLADNVEPQPPVGTNTTDG